MKRIDVYYGGQRYSVGNRSVDDLRAQIDAALAAGGGWVEVNWADGIATPAQVLISPGTPIALVAESPSDEDPES